MTAEKLGLRPGRDIALVSLAIALDKFFSRSERAEPNYAWLDVCAGLPARRYCNP